MSAFSAIDLSQLPPPEIVATPDFEAILAALIADFQARYPDYTEALESDPVVKLLETAAYRETLLRARINDAARACMLAYAGGTDLEHLGAWWGVTRRVIDPGDPAATPPVPATYESDASLRAQIQASLEAHTTAGPRGAYRWHAMATDPTLLDVGVDSRVPGKVHIAVLAADGAATQGQLDAVTAALNSEDVRPLCDTVEVEAAVLVPFSVAAAVTVGTGPDPLAVKAAAEAAVDAYCLTQRRCGGRIARSALFAACQQPGVLYTFISQPKADVITDAFSAPWLGTVTIGVAVQAP